ncbi:unnamed protein product [Spodoptera exigua]|nr:unnamed protein product [Spodoptera exigua]
MINAQTREQSVAACDGGGRVGHAVRRRGIGAGRAWRAPARHCGAGVRGARCTPLTRAPPAPAAAAAAARASPHRRRPHRADRAFGLRPAAACTGTTPYTAHATQHTLPIDCTLGFCTLRKVVTVHSHSEPD